MRSEVQYQDISYDSINKLPYFNFTEILKTGDLSHLGQHEDPQEVWLDIQNEYCIAAKIDNTNIKIQSKVIGLEWKYNFLIGCLEIIRHSHILQDIDGFLEMKVTAIKKMSVLGYIFRGREDFESEYKRIKTSLDGLYTKIELERGKIENAGKKQAINLWKDLVTLQKVIPEVPIDPYKDPVAKVIEVQNLAKDKQNEQRNHRHNNRR